MIPLSQVFAQGSLIRGTIFEEASGEPLYGVSVLVKELGIGAVTDFDGKFEIKVEPGTYSLKISFISYATIELQDVVVSATSNTLLPDILMVDETSELETVTVSAAAIRTTENALMSVKRNSPNVLDGISASAFRQIGDGDAAGAIKRVTGVSVEGGKYVYVRGLGDRYTKTVLNGVDIPGLDPDRNTIQMDIFPTNVIDNIIISKSFSAEVPADFTGGVVDIETKDFPEEKVARISISGGINPSMNFNSSYLKYKGGKTDWLGFDDGTRVIPTGGRTDIPQFGEVVGNPNTPKGLEYQETLRSFNKTLGGTQSSSLMNFGLNFSLGNQIARPRATWGYNVALTYKNDTQFFQDAEYNIYAKPADQSVIEMEPLERQKGNYGVNNVLAGGLAGIAMKTGNSKFKLNLLHLQNGESKAGIFEFQNSDLGAVFDATQYNLEYSERSLTSMLLSGSHFLNGGMWQVDWKLAPTRSSIEDPDIRFTRFRTPDISIGTEVGLPTRIWRFLEEDNLIGRLDLTRNLDLFQRGGKVRFGGNYAYKTRDFNIQSFQFSTGNTVFDGDPNKVLNEENLFSATNRNGVRHEPDFIPNNPNAYQSNLNNIAGYVSAEFSPAEKLKAVVGVRMEKFTQYYTGTNANATIVLDNEKVLDDLDLFPTLNLIYKLKENQNLRLSGSRTIARPSFKELSYAEILDPITGRSFIGGLFAETTDGGETVLWDGNLTATRISNFDLRWESFLERAQMFSVSAFYKSFDKPIELVQFLSDPGAFQPRNVGQGTVYGVEVEFRRSLSFILPAFKNFMWNTNVTLVESRIQMSATELRSRQITSREGQNIDNTRDMAGQAPYIINTGIAYQNFMNGWEAAISYNVQGPTLNLVGFGNRTDTFTVPFNSLNFNVNKTFGPDERISTSFRVSNILNDKRQIVFRSFEAQDQFFTNLAPGTEFSFSFGYSF